MIGTSAGFLLSFLILGLLLLLIILLFRRLQVYLQHDSLLYDNICNAWEKHHNIIELNTYNLSLI